MNVGPVGHIVSAFARKPGAGQLGSWELPAVACPNSRTTSFGEVSPERAPIIRVKAEQLGVNAFLHEKVGQREVIRQGTAVPGATVSAPATVSSLTA